MNPTSMQVLNVDVGSPTTTCLSLNLADQRVSSVEILEGSAHLSFSQNLVTVVLGSPHRSEFPLRAALPVNYRGGPPTSAEQGLIGLDDMH